MHQYIYVSAWCEKKTQPTYNDPPADTAGRSASKTKTPTTGAHQIRVKTPHPLPTRPS